MQQKGTWHRNEMAATPREAELRLAEVELQLAEAESQLAEAGLQPHFKTPAASMLRPNSDF